MNTAREIRNIWDEIGRIKGRVAGSSSGAVKAFLGLNDTPAAYAGAALQGVRVNAGTNALEFSVVADVFGPAGATDNALARFDTATGKLIQDSNAILSNAGELSLEGALFIAEIATPVARPNYGAIYPKNDNILYFQDGAGIEHSVNLSAADVVGPGASTDNALARFHLATGKIIQNSNAILNDAGLLFLAETANTKMTIGLTINQAGNDDEILALKSSDVAHGITTRTETDTYGFLKKQTGATGGLVVAGFSSDVYGLYLQSYFTNDQTTWTTPGALTLAAFKKSGTDVGNAHADQVLVAVRTYYSGAYANVWGVNASGNVWQTGSLGINTAVPTAWLHLPAGIATHPPLKFTAGTALTTPECGSIEFHDSRFYVTNISTRKAIDRTGDVVTSTVTVASTAVETTMWTAIMPANSLVAGNMLKFHADGVVSNKSAGGGDQVTLRIKVNGVTKATLTPLLKNFTNEHWHIDANACQRTVGGAGSRAIHIHLQMGTDEEVVIGVANIDTTANMDVTVTAEWASADAANTISLYQGYMEYKN